MKRSSIVFSLILAFLVLDAGTTASWSISSGALSVIIGLHLYTVIQRWIKNDPREEHDVI